MNGQTQDDEENNSFISALDNAAWSLAQQIAFCRDSAEQCMKAAWMPGPEATRDVLFSKAENFMRVAAEIAGALAQLKGDGNVRRQHITVERIGSPAPQPPKRVPPPLSRNGHPSGWRDGVREPSKEPAAQRDPEDGYDAAHHAAEKAHAERALAEYFKEVQAMGRGEGAILENESLRLHETDAATS